MEQAVKAVLADTRIHRHYVLESCKKMADYFISVERHEEARDILKRAELHDCSKLSGEELKMLAKISDNRESMKDPNKQLSPEQQELIQLHYKNNSHHPEHWEDVSQMPEMDVVEMVCDWHARSAQYGTDLIDFVKTRQKNRFHFPEEMFKQILEYCYVLVS